LWQFIDRIVGCPLDSQEAIARVTNTGVMLMFRNALMPSIKTNPGLLRVSVEAEDVQRIVEYDFSQMVSAFDGAGVHGAGFAEFMTMQV
jgi:hypothetical protein